MLGNQGNVQSNIMCTYSQSHASKEVSETHHMCLLMVTCDKINELTRSVHNKDDTKQKQGQVTFLQCLMAGQYSCNFTNSHKE